MAIRCTGVEWPHIMKPFEPGLGIVILDEPRNVKIHAPEREEDLSEHLCRENRSWPSTREHAQFVPLLTLLSMPSDQRNLSSVSKIIDGKA
jgi:hypothetical protein